MDKKTKNLDGAAVKDPQPETKEGESEETRRLKVYQFVGSAQSFDEVDALADATKLSDDIFDLTMMFDNIAWNIGRSETDVAQPKAKAKRVLVEAKNLVGRIEELIDGAEEGVDELDDLDDNKDADPAADPIIEPVDALVDVSDSGLSGKSIGSMVKDALINFGLWKPDTKILKEATSFKLLKSGGSYFLYGRPTNNILDLEDDILTSEAHTEFVKFLDDHPEEAPELWTWHTEGTARKNRAHWWDFSDGFVHLMWELTKEEAEGVERFCDEFEPGMSHGFYPLGVAPGIKILERKGSTITKYRMVEGSILPVEFAANPHTTFQVLVA